MEPTRPLDTRGFADFVKAVGDSLNGSRITYAVTGALDALTRETSFKLAMSFL